MGKKVLTNLEVTGYIDVDGGIKDANSSFGTAGHFLQTNGSDVVWASPPGATVGKSAKYVVWNNTLASDAGVAFSNNVCTITHNLGTAYVVVSAIDHSGWFNNANEQVDMNALFMVKCPSTSTTTLHFHSTAVPDSNEYPNFSVTIIG
jgi:hypothetical protein